MDDQIIAEAVIIKNGRQVIDAQCEVGKEDKTKLLARGTSNLMKLSMEMATEKTGMLTS